MFLFLIFALSAVTAEPYTRDETGRELYPEKVNGGDILKKGRYAKGANGKFYYPKDALGNEFMVKGFPLLQTFGMLVYPSMADGRPRYPLSVDGQREEYVQVKGRFILGTDAETNQYYARDSNGNEYYPPDNKTFARVRGKAVYASTREGETIFPMTPEGDEFYIGRIDPYFPQTHPTRYARTKRGRELYPYEDGGLLNRILNNTYAVLESGHPYYPIDRFNNQFYRDPVDSDVTLTGEIRNGSDWVLKNYALTNDGFIILPEFNRHYYIDANKPAIPGSAVIGHLFRDENWNEDFLTNKKWGRMPKYLSESYAYLTHGRELKLKNPEISLFKGCEEKSTSPWIFND